MQNVVFTQLSIPELETVIRNVVENCFSSQKVEKELPINEKPLLTVTEAAELLNLAKPTIYAFVQKSELPYMKKGKKLYFKKDDLLQWVQEGRKRTISEIQKDVSNEIQNTRKGGK